MQEEINQLKTRVAELERTITSFFRISKIILSKDIEVQNSRKFKFSTTDGGYIGSAAAEKIAFHGATPVVQAGAISSPSADASSLKTAVDAIRNVLINKGLTA